MRLTVDTDRCTGHGVCESIADDVFEVGADGIVHLLVDDVPPARREAVEEAVAECPTQALTLHLPSGQDPGGHDASSLESDLPRPSIEEEP